MNNMISDLLKKMSIYNDQSKLIFLCFMQKYCMVYTNTKGFYFLSDFILYTAGFTMLLIALRNKNIPSVDVKYS